MIVPMLPRDQSVLLEVAHTLQRGVGLQLEKNPADVRMKEAFGAGFDSSGGGEPTVGS